MHPTARQFATAVRSTAGLRRVGYRETQALAEAAAVRLADALGPVGLAEAAFVPIPRAGLVVLGLLSYLLDLRPEQLGSDPAAQRPLVVVDDCALSGLRVLETLGRWPDRQATVVHLLSPPPLRAALLRRPQVVAAVAGADLAVLEDRTGSASGDAWQRRLGSSRAWIGRAEPVCFPWGEPDGWLWDDEAGCLIPAPRSSPPHRSLKSRAALVGPLRHLPGGDWTLPGDLRWLERDGVFWLARPAGSVVSLEGTAAEAWRHLAGWGRLDVAARELARLWDIELEHAQDDLARFAQQLRGQGLLLGPGDDEATRDGGPASSDAAGAEDD